MSRSPDLSPLLADVFSANDSADAPGASPRASGDPALDALLARVRSRRRTRHSTRALGVVATLAVAAWFLRPASRAPEIADPVTTSAAAPSLVVRTAPLPAAMLVRTSAGAAPIIRSAPADGVALVNTTSMRGVVELIDDQKLFALLGGRPAIIKRRPDGTAELIFTHPADRDGFPAP